VARKASSGLPFLAPRKDVGKYAYRRILAAAVTRLRAARFIAPGLSPATR
jgi:hypothetical protein